MRQRDVFLAQLRARGEVWEPGPGLVGFRGRPLATLRRIERLLASLCARETDDEWIVPPAIPLKTLERAGYFASFPHWLTLASHLSDDHATLERVASSSEPAYAAAHATAPAAAALPPAVCYHVYTALAGSTLRGPRVMTAQACCWRHEGDRLTPLERGWAFTMREIVCVGSEAECAAFRERGVGIAETLAADLGLEWSIEPAEDPFFAPTARGRALLQRVKGLKHELRLPLGEGVTTAAASFNLHEQFFGEAFDIRLLNGEPAHTACVAFGLERWLLAVLLRADRNAIADSDADAPQEALA
jgi:seryl-tRNA synthetase